MGDKAHNLTDKELEEMEKHLSEIYERANRELVDKADKYFKRFAELDEQKKKLVDGGKLSEEDYKRWRQNKIMTGKHWTQMKEQTAQELLRANRTAAEYINGKLPGVYATNYNSTGKGIAGTVNGYSFETVDASTVKNLATSNKTLLPYKYVDGRKDERWNTQKVNAEILQGIIQGDSIPNLAKRLANVTEMNRASAIRNARTTVTSAENKGRMDSYHMAQENGVRMVKVWMATVDERTREEHIELDGQERDIDEPFENSLGEIMYPGDPDADPANVYNCRCTLITRVLGFGNEDAEAEDAVVDEAVQVFAIAEGKDISETWERRSDQFVFEIEDVINAQGFDGVPRVVSQQEFDEAVKESNFIAQRVYSAPDQETLDAYRASLYSGDWYVDCSSGGAAYGRGMYSVYSNGTSVTEYMEREMNGYKARRGSDYSYTETFTLAPGAKTITPEEIIELRNGYQKNLMEEFKKRGGWKNEEAIEWASNHDIHSLDDGSVAALFGYDAIITHGIDDYAVILNRTKVIFLGGKN